MMLSKPSDLVGSPAFTIDLCMRPTAAAAPGPCTCTQESICLRQTRRVHFKPPDRNALHFRTCASATQVQLKCSTFQAAAFSLQSVGIRPATISPSWNGQRALHLQVALVIVALDGALHAQLEVQVQHHAVRRNAQLLCQLQEIPPLGCVEVGAVNDHVDACGDNTPGLSV